MPLSSLSSCSLFADVGCQVNIVGRRWQTTKKVSVLIAGTDWRSWRKTGKVSLVGTLQRQGSFLNVQKYTVNDTFTANNFTFVC